VLRPSSLSLITSVGLNTGGLIGGVLIIESIFAIPGMGRLLVQSIFGEDFEVVQGLVLLFSAAFVLVNFAVDMFYSVVDPRIRRGSAS
jgi:peptide/nickel transport system permease protein